MTAGLESKLGGAVLLLAFVLALAACGGGGPKVVVPPASGVSVGSNRDRWGTTWLCRPGLRDDPCLADRTATVIEPSGAMHVEHAPGAKNPAVDCFYVYPTISDQRTVNASLAIGLRLRAVAIAQASRFSQVCKVYAPVYRQITLTALDHPGRITLANARVAYDSVLTAFHDYMVHYNSGRGVVFVGHSQGATILIRLLRREVDRRPAIRRRLVSALLLGGDVTVRKGATTGGDFAHIPVCTSPTETGCVVAYSSFTSRPATNSQFGRTSSDEGVGLLAPRHPSADLRVVCVNPAAPGGGTAFIDPYVPSLALRFLPASKLTVRTPWVSFPRQYAARCRSSGNATWLQVNRSGGGVDGLGLTGLAEPIVGLHILDLNLALGDLVRLVAHEVAAYRRR
jgi:hypothetical protein